MGKYRAVMTAFGLSRGDTFESNDPAWENHVEAGNISRADDNTSPTVTDDIGDKMPTAGELEAAGKKRLSKKEVQRRQDTGDQNPVKPGEFFSETVQEVDGG